MERNPIEYKVFSGASHQEMTSKINQALKEGWVLYGNPLYLPPSASEGLTEGWAQAMVRLG